MHSASQRKWQICCEQRAFFIGDLLTDTAKDGVIDILLVTMVYLRQLSLDPLLQTVAKDRMPLLGADEVNGLVAILAQPVLDRVVPQG